VRAERRKSERLRRRILCDVLVAGHWHSGVVCDISSSGLFVQTDLTAPPRTPVRVRLRGPDGSPIELKGLVARQQTGTRDPTSVARVGLGIRLTEPPPAQFREISLGRTAGERLGSPEGERGRGRSGRAEAHSYRVRVKEIGGSRTRSFEVRATSEGHAAELALAVLGGPWEIVGVEAG